MADPFFNSDVLLAGNDNKANGSTSFADQSNSAHALIAHNSVQYSTASPPPGMTSAILFAAATSDWIESADSNDWNFAAGDFTIESYINFVTTAGTMSVMTQWNTTFSWSFDTSGGLRFANADTGGGRHDQTIAWTPSAGVWYHVMACRSGSDFYMGVDGVVTKTANGTFTHTLRDSPELLNLGSQNNGTAQKLNGYLCSPRITKGVGRYTANFTRPSLPLPISTTDPVVAVGGHGSEQYDEPRRVTIAGKTYTVTSKQQYLGLLARATRDKAREDANASIKRAQSSAKASLEAKTTPSVDTAELARLLRIAMQKDAAAIAQQAEENAIPIDLLMLVAEDL